MKREKEDRVWKEGIREGRRREMYMEKGAIRWMEREK